MTKDATRHTGTVMFHCGMICWIECLRRGEALGAWRQLVREDLSWTTSAQREKKQQHIVQGWTFSSTSQQIQIYIDNIPLIFILHSQKMKVSVFTLMSLVLLGWRGCVLVQAFYWSHTVRDYRLEPTQPKAPTNPILQGDDWCTLLLSPRG